MNPLQRIIIFLGLLMVAGFCPRPPHQWERTTFMINRENGAPHKVEVSKENIGHRSPRNRCHSQSPAL